MGILSICHGKITGSIKPFEYHQSVTVGEKCKFHQLVAEKTVNFVNWSWEKIAEFVNDKKKSEFHQLVADFPPPPQIS